MIVIICGLLMIGFGVFLIWNYEYVFEFNDWKKYLVCGILLFLAFILIIKTFMMIYYSVGMWVENKVILLKEK